MEIIILITAGILIPALGAGATLFFFASNKAVKKLVNKQYLVISTKHKTRFRIDPKSVINSTLEDFDNVTDIVLAKYKAFRPHILNPESSLVDLKVDFVPSESKEQRYITNELGIKIAGNYDPFNHIVRLVYKPGDRVINTAWAHELGHVLHTLEKKIDLDHSDKEMWRQIARI